MPSTPFPSARVRGCYHTLGHYPGHALVTSRTWCPDPPVSPQFDDLAAVRLPIPEQATRWLYPTARRRSKTCSRGGLPLFIPAGMPIFSISFQPTGQPPVFPRRQPCFSFLSRRFSNGGRLLTSSALVGQERERERDVQSLASPVPRDIGSSVTLPP